MRNTRRTKELAAIRQQRRRELIRARYLWAVARRNAVRMDAKRREAA